ncbi:KamA family radical SAM protein [Desulfotalea psychrophila]|uniref:Radical SAM core domain-containing protein n=1 Tax=Desulfotalea psychrophila (strain LSv54 / DSM 12343) TaxID=177439 RepID=Q6AL42_DESPS|nr:KamA family radical SAM protein [Desulfotalea psychrophila]CAG36933.1 conserved hypothetical protein [Desulfotalea psychrophila LSv54]
MNNWKNILQESITSPSQLHLFKKKHQNLNETISNKVIPDFPMRINSYFLSLIEEVGDPIWKQCIPDPREEEDFICMEDPLGEEALSPVPNLVHKYPDRALLLVTNQCAVYCRFCTRKRMVGTERMHITEENLQACYDYLRRTPAIREVLISGGDPLLLADDKIDHILSELQSIPSIDVIRIGSRVPCTLPMRITPELVAILRKYHPLYINTHFNHPRELTPEAKKACALLADGGIPLGCQTVLLKGVNDNAQTLKELFLGLLKMRVKPYYLFQADLTRGTNHFRTTTKTGIDIMRQLYGHISGMAIPRLALDAPGGKGKIPLSPNYIKESGENLIFENYLGEICSYPEAVDPL